MGFRIALAAPTGRAAKKMQEATGHIAMTIHRLLKYDVGKGGFSYNIQHPIKADLLIVDECSMVDQVLFHHLLQALPDHISLILVGDVDQLPSVGAGQVLNDVINSGVVPVIRLKEIFRQAKKSLIVTNAHLINRGEMPILPQKKTDKFLDFYFVSKEDPEDAFDIIKKLITERIPARYQIEARDIQVISPMHKGTLGTSNLNFRLQDTLNPKGEEIVKGYRRFRVGDRVMQTRNNYEKEIFNGDVGIIVKFDPEFREVHVDFDGEIKIYDFYEVDELSLAYAISIHKAQGSEYPAVIIPLFTQHYVLLERNLLYTAITRAKKLVILVGMKKALYIALGRSTSKKRYTRFAERIRDYALGNTPVPNEIRQQSLF
jgi:exodeoxyribonuclease V alpha subunit